ncbi:MAG: hypothetical protein ACREXK_10465 [Gammaproteobacteria bacterium]
MERGFVVADVERLPKDKQALYTISGGRRYSTRGCERRKSPLMTDDHVIPPNDPIPSDLIPGDLREFILKRLDSIAQLEALLLLRRSPDQRWDVATVAKRLYIAERDTAAVLDRLCADGLLVCGEDKYQYRPATAELDQLVGHVAELYAKHLIPVTNLIHSKPLTRVREFADAFKLKKDN